MAIMLLKSIEMKINIKEVILPFFALFTSISTIICCALPIILVMLGMGAVFANLTANFPFIIWLAGKSLYLFIIAIIFLLIGGYFIFLKAETCPADKKLADICQKTKKFNKSHNLQDRLYLLFFIFFSLILIFSFKIIHISLSKKNLYSSDEQLTKF